MYDTHAYEAETDGIVVRVRPSYLAGQSDPESGRWVWAYQVEIENRGAAAVQLVARHWIITDARGPDRAKPHRAGRLQPGARHP